jgi:CobQ-like glutamine amidotransferase family enzyme
MTAPLRIVVVYPDLLGTYGDGGNGLILARRAQWRGVEVELAPAPSDAPLPEADIYCLGGGEDGPQVRAARSLVDDGTLARRVSAGAVVLAVCAGYQIVGQEFPGADGTPHEGVGLLDLVTLKGTGTRAVGEVVAQVSGEVNAGASATATGRPPKVPSMAGCSAPTSMDRCWPATRHWPICCWGGLCRLTSWPHSTTAPTRRSAKSDWLPRV